MVIIYEKTDEGLVEVDRFEDVDVVTDGMYEFLIEKYEMVDEAQEMFQDGYLVKGNRHFVIRNEKVDVVAEREV